MAAKEKDGVAVRRNKLRPEVLKSIATSGRHRRRNGYPGNPYCKTPPKGDLRLDRSRHLPVGKIAMLASLFSWPTMRSKVTIPNWFDFSPGYFQAGWIL